MASAAKNTGSGATYQIVRILLEGLPQHFQEAIRPYLYSVILGSGVDLRKDLPKELAIIRDRLNIVRSNPQIMLKFLPRNLTLRKQLLPASRKKSGNIRINNYKHD